jgi:chromosomal replication initiation ATPase DnaA
MTTKKQLWHAWKQALEQPTTDDARRFIGWYRNLYERKTDNAAYILKAVCQVYKTTLEDLAGPSRYRPLPEARHVFFYVAMQDGKTPPAEIGLRCRRHRTSVQTAITPSRPDSIPSRMMYDADLRTKIAEVRRIAVEMDS